MLGMSEKPYRIAVMWDDEAQVFVAHSDDIYGLNTEAETLPLLREKVLACAMDLLQLEEEKSRGFLFDPQSFFVSPEAIACG
ncbi:MAG: DUF1902 domain-containing protein [Rhodospirillales bacterium]|nr:DUF1902 domain-containing protein [Rhodospirillales bacterium]MCB9996416.1 DUF1902 domain-containing protein [Rhodospirillales bacterium]